MAMSQQFPPPVNRYTGSFTEDAEGDGLLMNAFGHEGADVAFDPLSANRCFAGTADLAVLGTLVFAGPTWESIAVITLHHATGEWYGSCGFTPPYWLVPGTCCGYDQLGTGAQFGEGFVSGVSCRHLGTPATRLLGRT